MEKRKFTRIPFQCEATVSKGETEIQGQVNDLCLSGMYFVCDKKFKIGDKLSIKLLLDNRAVYVQGKVVRKTNTGMAVEFLLEGIELDTLTDLKYIVSLNLGDSKLVMTEFRDYLENYRNK